MKTLIALVLAVILLSACREEKKFTGYVEVGTNPIKTYYKHLINDGYQTITTNGYYSITTVEVKLDDGSTITATFPLNEWKFPGHYYLQDRSLNPEIKDIRIYVAGKYGGDGTPFIQEAGPYEKMHRSFR